MKKFLFLMAFLLTACGTTAPPTPTPTPTPNPGDILMNMLQQEVASKATQQVIGSQFTATAMVVGATAMAEQQRINARQTEQARTDAIATADQARANEAATQARIDTIATAEQARVDAISTQSALATATFTSMTMTAIPPHATMTQIAVNNEITINAQNVERSDLSLKQARDTNVLQWLGPTLLASFLALVYAGYLYYQSQVRVEKNETGDVDIIIYKNQKAFRPDLFHAPMLDLKTNEMPMLAAPEEQSKVTMRAQAIKALSVMPAAPAANASAGFNSTFNEPSAPPTVQIINDMKALSPVLEEAEAKLIEEEGND